MRDEHRHLRAIFTRVENLLRLEIRWIEVDFGLTENRALTRRHVVAIDRGRRSETCKRVERFFICWFAAETLR
jgi:hypothetical protein